MCVFIDNKPNLLCISPSCLNTLVRTCKLWGTNMFRLLSLTAPLCLQERKRLWSRSDSVMAQWHRQKTSVRPTFFNRYRYDDIYISFTFMHLADAFIQSDLHCIQVSTFYQLLLSLGIEPMILALLAPCSTSWATGKLRKWLFTQSNNCKERQTEGKRVI